YMAYPVPCLSLEVDENVHNVGSRLEQNTVAGPAYVPGLLTWSGGTVDTGATAVDGMAATITVSSSVITSQGGDPMRLRDGGV
ncbi:flagellar hook-associated protein FlgK, partial [Rhizobium ruizarguesonis]